VEMSTNSQNGKRRKILGGLILAGVLACLFLTTHYYKNNFEYNELENRLTEIHTEIDGQIPVDKLEVTDIFMAGIYIRNTYNLRDDNSELRALFIQNGVSHPDNMSTLILETFIRAKRDMPFQLHKLIMVQNKIHEHLMNNGNRDNLYSEMLEEFIIYEKHRDKKRLTN